MGEQEARRIHSELFRTLDKEIVDTELDEIKRILNLKEFGGFGAGEIAREIKTGHDALEKLKRKGRIKLGNYQKLKKLFAEVHADHLIEFVDAAEQKLRAIHWPVESDESAAAGYTPGGAYNIPQPYHPQPYVQHPSHSGIPPQRHEAPPRYHHSFQPISYQDGGTMPPPQHVPPHLRHPAPHPYEQPQPPLANQQDPAVLERRPFDIYYEPGCAYVLFINNIFAEGEKQYRSGAEEDERNVRQLFNGHLKKHYLQYEKDVTKHELLRYLTSLKTTLGSGIYRSFMLILGTHGEPKANANGGPKKDAVLMADNQWIHVDTIVENFHGDEIPAMKDKPKIFIIQSCRGIKKQRLTSHSDAPAELSDPQFGYEPPQGKMLTRPVNSDVLIAHATSPGTKAWRNEVEGSWFVKDLCDTIRRYYNKEHILDILVRVNNEIIKRESTEGGAKQMPCFICTFTKRFMFTALPR